MCYYFLLLKKMQLFIGYTYLLCIYTPIIYFVLFFVHNEIVLSYNSIILFYLTDVLFSINLATYKTSI